VVVSSRRGLLRRVADELADLQRTRAHLRRVEADMVAVGCVIWGSCYGRGWVVMRADD